MIDKLTKSGGESKGGLQTAPKKIEARLRTRRKGVRLLCVLTSIMVLVSGAVYAQTSKFMPPIIMLLLDEVDNRLKAFATGKLNDTGITLGMDIGSTEFNATCTADTAGPQDCNYGADLQLDSDADGHAGFSFTLVDDNGELQDPQDKNTACAVLDNVTGLMWDSGRPETGLKSPSATFVWSTKDFDFGSFDILGNHANCPGYDSSDSSTYCNTATYIDRLNAARWCGHSDWRLPSSGELKGIKDYSVTSGTRLDTDYFWAMKTSATDDRGRTWSSTFYPFPIINNNPEPKKDLTYQHTILYGEYFEYEDQFGTNYTGENLVRVVRHD